jgi:hypothetical protein
MNEKADLGTGVIVACLVIALLTGGSTESWLSIYGDFERCGEETALSR